MSVSSTRLDELHTLLERVEPFVRGTIMSRVLQAQYEQLLHEASVPSANALFVQHEQFYRGTIMRILNTYASRSSIPALNPQQQEAQQQTPAAPEPSSPGSDGPSLPSLQSVSAQNMTTMSIAPGEYFEAENPANHSVDWRQRAVAMRQALERQKPDEMKYAINAAWWDRVCRSIGLRDGTRDMTSGPMVPLDNSSITIEGTGRLREGLRERRDFVIVPEMAFRLCMKWHGGGPAVPLTPATQTVMREQGRRLIIRAHKGDSEKTVECGIIPVYENRMTVGELKRMLFDQCISPVQRSELGITIDKCVFRVLNNDRKVIPSGNGIDKQLLQSLSLPSDPVISVTFSDAEDRVCDECIKAALEFGIEKEEAEIAVKLLKDDHALLGRPLNVVIGDMVERVFKRRENLSINVLAKKGNVPSFDQTGEKEKAFPQTSSTKPTERIAPSKAPFAVRYVQSSSSSRSSSSSSSASAYPAAAFPAVTATVGLDEKECQQKPIQPSKSEGGAEAGKGRTCVVCMSDVPNFAFVPCGHVVLCSNCASSYPVSRGCPLCRAPATMLMKVYLQ